jgi:hypothetical protein
MHVHVNMYMNIFKHVHSYKSLYVESAALRRVGTWTGNTTEVTVLVDGYGSGFHICKNDSFPHSELTGDTEMHIYVYVYIYIHIFIYIYIHIYVYI